MTDPTAPIDHSPAAQSARRADLWAKIRSVCKRFFDAGGQFDANGFSPGVPPACDQRIVVELAIALLQGDASDRAFAEKILRANDLMIGSCAFTMDYILALWHASGDRLTPETRQWILEKIRHGSSTSVSAETLKGKGASGHDVSHRGFNLKGIQWHGYNENHVAMATSSLILGGELIGDRSLVDAGHAVLLNMRDTLQRRGFIHECNDGYLPHTMYPLAAIAAWSESEDLRDLARNGLERIWSDLLGHWHPNLGRKIGPSARDYTAGRLSSSGWLVMLHYVFGPGALPAWLNIEDIVHPESTPASRKFQWPFSDSNAWSLGFIARVVAQTFTVPPTLAPLVAKKRYPFEITGTNEFGNMLEIHEEVCADGSKIQHGLHNVQYAGGPHLLTTYMEADWGMGTADQRLLGPCPNNNWQVSYRKKRPMKHIRDQGSWYCSYTINGKVASEDNDLQAIEGMPDSLVHHGPAQFADAGRFAGIQHRRTAIMVYRPRPLENWRIDSLALTLMYPLHYGNELDELWFGDTRVDDWSAHAGEFHDIFVKDGPVYLGFRPLVPPWLPVDGSEPLHRDVCLRAERRGLWGCVHIYSYKGPQIAIRNECDLARIGNGFVIETATKKDFPTLAEFKAWFRTAQVVDDTFHWQRLIRYHRDESHGRPKLDLALRWDAWQDRILFRSLNGRSLPEPMFHCTGIDNRTLPWLTGDVGNHDNFSWLPPLIARPQHKHGHQPQPLRVVTPPPNGPAFSPRSCPG